MRIAAGVAAITVKIAGLRRRDGYEVGGLESVVGKELVADVPLLLLVVQHCVADENVAEVNDGLPAEVSLVQIVYGSVKHGVDEIEALFFDGVEMLLIVVDKILVKLAVHSPDDHLACQRTLDCIKKEVDEFIVFHNPIAFQQK